MANSQDEVNDSIEESCKLVKSHTNTCTLKELSYLFSGTYSNVCTSNEGMYGEIKSNCLYKICQEMVKFGLDDTSIILDLGSGRGVPNVFLSSLSGAFSSIGIEKCSTAYLVSVQIVIDLLNRDLQDIYNESNVNSPDTSSCKCIPNLINQKRLHDSNEVSTNKRQNTSNSSIHGTDYVDSLFEHDGDTTQSDLNLTQSVSPGAYSVERSASQKIDRGVELKRGLTLKDLESNEEMRTPKPRRGKNPLLANSSSSRHGIGFINQDISSFDNFDGVTHFYSFDSAMEGPLVNNIVYQFQNTKTAWVYCSFHGDLITKYDLKDCFIGAKIPCRMCVSNEHHNCYVYVKNDWQEIKKSALEFLSKNFENIHTNSPLPSGIRTPYTGTFNINDWDEPCTALDLIKLSKCPIMVQYEWYKTKLDRALSTRVTRSKSEAIWNSSRRASLSSERDEYLEELANTPDRLEQISIRNKLVKHINDHYSVSGSYPN